MTVRDELRRLQAQHRPANLPDAPQYPLGEIALTDCLRRRARERPDHVALVYYGAEWSYAELDRLSDRFAALLAARGIRRGERVAVFMPNCPQFAIAFYGILKLGCVHVPVNPLFKEFELRHELADSDAVALVALDSLMPLVRAVRETSRLRAVFVTSFADVLPATPAFPVPESVRAPRIACPDAEELLPALASVTSEAPALAADLDAVAALNYTGGTTGMPKGCVHTQRHMVYTAATACAVVSPMGPDDVCLCFVPIFWIAGEDMGLIFPIFAGATLVLLTRWDPAGFAAAIERYRVTSTYLLVDNVAEVLERSETARFDLTSLRTVRVSSFVKKLTVEYRERWRDRTGSTLVEAAWGMTETHTCDTYVTGFQDGDRDLRTQPIFAGLPVPGTEIAIHDFESGVPLPLGTEGEIWVRSPSLLNEYWKKPVESAEALRDGWLRTGDIGTLDEDGFLHFLGRRKEMLKYRGMSVFPAEIEAFLGRHPAVAGSAVIGREDSASGEVPVAFVVLDPARAGELRASDLEAWCRENLATYKVPEIHLVASLPLTATGKVKKDELRALVRTADA